MKKRYLSIVFVLLLILGLLSGCGKKSSSDITYSSAKETTAKTSLAEEIKTTADQTTAVETTALETAAPETTEAEIITEEETSQEPTTSQETIQEETSQEETVPSDAEEESTEERASVFEDGEYSSKEEVALYLHLYGHLPSNYITKKEAENLGWVASKGNLWKVAPGKSIGGDRFGNYEKLLPTTKGRQYAECDIDFDGGRRNSKRIIFSNDGLVYYTEDHYKSFELLYGEE